VSAEEIYRLVRMWRFREKICDGLNSLKIKLVQNLTPPVEIGDYDLPDIYFGNHGRGD
jgi:hypothetical protein